MSSDQPTTHETDDRFPSGPWKGFFKQQMLADAKRQMELHLSFINGRVTGTGRDGIGAFSIVGHYEVESGKVWWTKKYSTHDVFYQGFAEENSIWGTWDIPPFHRDGFRIWPKGIADAMEHIEREEQQDTPVSFEADDLIESETQVGKKTAYVP